MGTEEILRVEDLNIEFATSNGTFKAIRDISFNLNKGEILGIVGESGCGKSVTSLSIMGLLPKGISSIPKGKILFEGNDLTKYTKSQMSAIRGNELSMIFQEPMTSLNPVFTVGDQIGRVIRNHEKNIKKQKLNKRIIDLLKQVGIPRPEQVMNEYPHQLSGGMRQRIMIAMAISCNPKVLIADEPTTALDVTIQAQILDLLKNLSKEMDMGLILITHDLGVVAEMCDRVVVMYSGEVVEHAEKYEFFKQPLHPYSNGLLASIPRMGASDEDLYFIKGNVPHPSEKIQGCRYRTRCDLSFDKCINVPALFEVDGRQSRCFLVEEKVTQC